MIHEFVCIVCPRGCRLKVDPAEDYSVTGNACPRGVPYGRQEAKMPLRTVTTTVDIAGAREIRCPVKTSTPVPKAVAAAVIQAAKALRLKAPVVCGQVAAHNIAETGADLIVTRSLPAAEAADGMGSSELKP